MLNRVQLIGHLGRAPETRRLGSGDPVVNMRLATSETWKDKTTGEKKDNTEWHSIVIYNENLCRVAEQYTKKGSRIYVEGTLRTRKWTDDKGVERYSTEIVLGRFNGTLTLLDRAGERSAPEPDSYGTTRTREGTSGGTPGTGGGRGGYDLDDDIPF